MATVQYQDKTTGIIFSSVDVESSPKVAISGKLYRSGWSNTAITGVSNTDTALPTNTDAIFIDWNGATLDSTTVINTTADLLKYIKAKSDLTIGNTSYTAAAGDHTHELTLQENAYATSSIDLLDNTIYTLNAGGKSLAFKTPSGGATYKAGTNIGIDLLEPMPINPIAKSINTSNSDISTVDAGTSHIASSSIIGNPSVLTIYHATPKNATEGQKGDTSENLLAYIITDKQGHVTGYKTITPEELWSLLRPYADALYLPKPKPIIGVTDILLNKDTLPISVNGTGEVIATISPDNATNKNITWTSSNETIATVTSHTTSGSPAIVTWKSGGNTTITATAEGDESKQKTCIILCQSPQPATTYYYAGQNAGDTYITSNNYTTIATQSEFTTKDVDMTVGNYLYVVVPSTKTVEITDPAGSFITMNFYNSSTGAYAKTQNLATDEYYLIRSRGAAAIAEKWTVKVS